MGGLELEGRIVDGFASLSGEYEDAKIFSASLLQLLSVGGMLVLPYRLLLGADLL